MNCPKCGAVLPEKKSKCPKCGYIYKSIVFDDPFIQASENVKEVKPSQVNFKKHKNSDGSFFSGSFGSVMGNLFGDFFDMGKEEDGYNADPKNYDDFGNQIDVPDEFNSQSIEINDIEIVEEDQNADNSAKKDSIKNKGEKK